MIAVASVPRTLTGEVLEVPVKRIPAATPVRAGGQPHALMNPAALEPLVEIAGAQPGSGRAVGPGG